MCDGRCALGMAGGHALPGVGEPDRHLDLAGELGPEAREAGGVSRRDFIGRSTLAAVAALLTAACGTGADILAARAPTAPGALGGGGLSLRLADYPALAQVGGIARADTAAGPIALVRTSSTVVSAFSMVCPHQGSTINIQGSGFLCPNHGARFSAAGQWTGGQPTTNLVSYATTFDPAAGLITVGTAGVAPGQPQNPGSPNNPGGSSINLVVDISKFPALATVGGVARVDGGSGVPVGAVRTSSSQFGAYTLVCTHQGATVQLSGGGWTCPSHGAQFNASGAVTRGPAALPLQALTAAYDPATDQLTITGSGSSGRLGGDDDDG